MIDKYHFIERPTQRAGRDFTSALWHRDVKTTCALFHNVYKVALNDIIPKADTIQEQLYLGVVEVLTHVFMHLIYCMLDCLSKQLLTRVASIYVAVSPCGDELFMVTERARKSAAISMYQFVW